MLTSSSPRSFRIATLLVCLCGLSAIALLQRSRTWRPANVYHRPIHNASHIDDMLCRLFPDPQNIAIAVKTGATEAVERIPIMLMTSLKCAENIMLFSDLEQNIAGHHLHDALRNIPKSAMEGNTDFDFYWHLKEAHQYGEVETMLKGATDPRLESTPAAWTLDKYKQLHILEELYAEYPDKDWYLMIDADTYLIWPNLLIWTQQLPDPRRNKLYLGSKAMVDDNKFAHGGSGIFMSHATMYDFAVTHAGAAARWDVPLHEECCGDLVIGLELKKNGIQLKQAWPTTTGERIVTTPFGPKHWCQPVVTLHHMLPTEMNQMSTMLRSRRDIEGPIIYADLFNYFLRDVIPDMLDWWDNVSLDQDIEVESYEACREACVADEQCFQFSFHGKQCALGYSVHLGEPRQPEDNVTWQSGWLAERIYAWVDAQPPCKTQFPWTSLWF